MSDGKIVRIAVIGLGGRGLYFAGAYHQQAHPGFHLHALCDLSPEQLDKARTRFGDGVTYFTDMHEMLRDPELDAVIVATNDPHHVEPALASLNAGKHVLIEKPLCQTVEDANKLLAAAQASAGVFVIGFELRECTVFLEMKRLLDEGRIGEVKIGHCFDNVSVGGNYFYHDPQKQKAFYKSLLLQKATHSLDLLNWFMGSNPVKVYGIGGMDFYGQQADPNLHCRECEKATTCPYVVDPKHFQMDYDAVVETSDHCVWSTEMDLNDNSELCISYANGGKATFHECHFTPDYTREFWLIGTRGKMYGYFDNPGRFLIRIEYSYSAERRTEEWKPLPGSGSHGGGDSGLREEFYRRIVENDHSPEALRSAYYSTALAICAEGSIESGMPVLIPPPFESSVL